MADEITKPGYLFVWRDGTTFLLNGIHTLQESLGVVQNCHSGEVRVGFQNTSPWFGDIKRLIGGTCFVLGFWVPEGVSVEQFRAFLAQEDASFAGTIHLDALSEDSGSPVVADVSEHPLGRVIEERRPC
jgi:hypothetical protein